MAAFLIVNIEIHDAVQYEEYKRLVAPTIAAYGGRYLARGGFAETLEGDWQVKRMVILEFESVGRAKQWWSSVEYSEAKALRQRITDTQMIIVESL